MHTMYVIQNNLPAAERDAESPEEVVADPADLMILTMAPSATDK